MFSPVKNLYAFLAFLYVSSSRTRDVLSFTTADSTCGCTLFILVDLYPISLLIISSRHVHHYHMGVLTLPGPGPFPTNPGETCVAFSAHCYLESCCLHVQPSHYNEINHMRPLLVFAFYECKYLVNILFWLPSRVYTFDSRGLVF